MIPRYNKKSILWAVSYDRANERDTELALVSPSARWAQPRLLVQAGLLSSFWKVPTARAKHKRKSRPFWVGAFLFECSVLAVSYFPPFGVSSPLRGLTAVFGMGTGVTLSPNHQDRTLNVLRSSKLAPRTQTLFVRDLHTSP